MIATDEFIFVTHDLKRLFTMTFDIDFMNYHWKQQIFSSATGHIFPIFIGLTS